MFHAQRKVHCLVYATLQHITWVAIIFLALSTSLSLQSIPEWLLTERCEIWGRWPFVCVLKFDSPLPEDHRVNILSTADTLLQIGGSASILGTSVYLRPKLGRKIVRRPQRAQSDCPTRDRGAALTRQAWAWVMRPGLTAGALGPSIVSLNTNKSKVK